MPYYTGSATDHSDCFAKVRAHAALNGWSTLFATVDEVDTSIFQKDGFKLTLPEDIEGTGVVQLLPTIESTSTGTNNLGVLAERGEQRLSMFRDESVISYHAFIDVGTTPFICLVMQVKPNVWRHLLFGIVEKTGSWQGGAFLGITFINSLGGAADWDAPDNVSIGVTADNLTDQSCFISYTDDLGVLGWGNKVTHTGFSLGFAKTPSEAAVMYSHQPNEETGETLIVPVELFTDADVSGVRRAGRIPEMGLTNVLLMQQEQAVVIDTDTWVFFPARAIGKVADTGYDEESHYLGYAYKK